MSASVNHQISEVDLCRFLGKHPGIEKLDISLCRKITDACLPVLASLENLKSIDIRSTRINVERLTEEFLARGRHPNIIYSVENSPIEREFALRNIPPRN